jgi:hypothetical protein
MKLISVALIVALNYCSSPSWRTKIGNSSYILGAHVKESTIEVYMLVSSQAFVR